MPSMHPLSLPLELQSTFTSPKALEELRSFASDSFCEENILFLEQVLELKQTANPGLIMPIVSRFIRTDSPCQVNIDSFMQDQILQRVLLFKPSSAAPPDPSFFDLFDAAFDHVATMVQTDVIPRFKQSHSLPASPSSTLLGSRRGLTPRGHLSKAASASSFSPATLPSSPSSASLQQAITAAAAADGGSRATWYRGHLLRRKGFFAQWKPFTYMKKGAFLFEFKPGANHVTSEPLTMISLKQCLVEPARIITGKAHSFLLTTADNRTFFFQAASHEEMREWIEELSSFSVSLMNLRSRDPSPPSSASSASSGHDHSSLHSSSSSTASSSSSSSSSPSSASSASSAPAPPGAFVVLKEEELAQALPILGFLESFTDAVVVGDSRGLVVAFNSAACKMFGHSKEESKQLFLSQLMPEPYSSNHDGYLFRHEKHGEEKLIGKTRNLQGLRKGGEVFQLQISLGKLPVPGYFLATLRERTGDETTEVPP